MVKLAAIRFTSYSNGPGRVSSKSFRSNSSRRSGEANTPKFDRCASPHSCTCSPAVGVSLRSAAMILAAAPVEGERRHQHPPMPDRHQVRLPGEVLLLQQPDRIGPVGRRRPAGVAGQRRPVARLLAPRSAFLDARVGDPLDGHRLRPCLDGHRLHPSVPSVPLGLHGRTSARRRHHPDEMKHPPAGALGGRQTSRVCTCRSQTSWWPALPTRCPLTIRVKGLMALQSLISLAVQPGEARGHPGTSRGGRRHGCRNARLRLATQSGRSIASALLVLVRR